MSKGTAPDWRILLDQHLDSTAGRGTRIFVALLGWTYFEIAGIGHDVEVAGHKIGGLFDLEGPTAEGDAGGHRRHGESRQRRSDLQEGHVPRRQDEAAFRRHGSGSHGRLLRSERRSSTSGNRRRTTAPTWTPVCTAAPGWFETSTSDVDCASAFYTGLFGWTPETTTPMPGVQYTTLKHGNEYVAGMMPLTPQMGTTQPHWGTYFTVRDADETAREAVKLGAKLCVPPQDIPGVGRFGGVTSPQGVTFYVITFTCADATYSGRLLREDPALAIKSRHGRAIAFRRVVEVVTRDFRCGATHGPAWAKHAGRENVQAPSPAVLDGDYMGSMTSTRNISTRCVPSSSKMAMARPPFSHATFSGCLTVNERPLVIDIKKGWEGTRIGHLSEPVWRGHGWLPSCLVYQSSNYATVPPRSTP